MATTPYRKLQERVKELEDISKVHQKQNGDLHLKIADLETVVNLQKSRIDTSMKNFKTSILYAIY